MTWKSKIKDELEMAVEIGETDESSFYRPYHALLLHLFPHTEDFTVYCQYQPVNFQVDENKTRKKRELIKMDFSCPFTVEYRDCPVLFIDVRPAGEIHSVESRDIADFVARKRYKSFAADAQIEMLYGISALGTNLSIYTYDENSRSIIPRRVLGGRKSLADTAPVDRWCIDILTPQGEQSLRDVVAHIKDMCTRSHSAN